MPSGASGPVSGSGAPKRMTSSAAADAYRLEPMMAINKAVETAEKPKPERNINISRTAPHRGPFKHGKSAT